MRMLVAGATLVLLGSLSACGQQSPVSDDPGFARASGDTRLAERYDQDAARATYPVDLPSGSAHVQVHLDCVAESSRALTVRIGSLGAAAVPCGPESTEGGALIGLGAKSWGGPGEQRLTVTAPAGAHWSFAVDAG